MQSTSAPYAITSAGRKSVTLYPVQYVWIEFIADYIYRCTGLYIHQLPRNWKKVLYVRPVMIENHCSDFHFSVFYSIIDKLLVSECAESLILYLSICYRIS